MGKVRLEKKKLNQSIHFNKQITHVKCVDSFVRLCNIGRIISIINEVRLS